jgi:hypothetical protein
MRTVFKNAIDVDLDAKFPVMSSARRWPASVRTSPTCASSSNSPN